MNADGLMLRARTAAHVRPAQVANRSRLRLQAAALRRWPGTGRLVLAGPEPARGTGWPADFAAADAQAPERWPSLAELAAHTIRTLGVARQLGDPPDWRHASAPTLWRHHVHYWDWALGLTAEPDVLASRAVFAGLWRSWRSAVGYGRSEAWLPYPAATRAWSWCAAYGHLVAGSDIEAEFRADLAAHAGFLRHNLETDIGGNHLLRELKALAGLAVFFGDGQLLETALTRLEQQVALQVHPDGGHYERAPAYHCLVLADLIDVAGLLSAAGRAPSPAITAAIARMRRWLGWVLSPSGVVPPLNDGYAVDGGLLSVLRPDPPPDGPLRYLPDSGLAVATAGGWHLLADVGDPGPDELPAHAHAGTLGCLVHVDGVPLLTDTGTSTYEPGHVRDYERSTAAHNTVEVDGSSSTEVWGAFRAGRRARTFDVTARGDAAEVVVRAAHDGYRHLPGRPVHRRRWSLTPDGLTVRDLVAGEGRHTVAVRWHLPADASSRPGKAGGRTVTTPAGSFSMTVISTLPGKLAMRPHPVAAGFGHRTDTPVLVWRARGNLPIQITTTWRRAAATGGTA